MRMIQEEKEGKEGRREGRRGKDERKT